MNQPQPACGATERLDLAPKRRGMADRAACASQAKKENDVTLKDKIRKRVMAGKELSPGFLLPKPPIQHFKSADPFFTAIQAQSDSVAMIDGKHVTRVDIEGNIEGTDWRLSHAAFSDLCHWMKTPVTFVKLLAKIEEALALDVVAAMIEGAFKQGKDKLLVIDTRFGRVEGIVGKDTYSPISHVDVWKYANTAMNDLEMSNGWLCGPQMRMTAIDPKKPVEPKKGDAVHFGATLGNAINGDGSCWVSDYFERLVCTNGMVARDKEHTERIEHRGDVQYKVQEAVLKASTRSTLLGPAMHAAARTFLDAPGIKTIRTYLKEGRNGGSPKLDVAVTQAAMQEAVKDSRAEEEVTLWDFVNGITEHAHTAKTLTRRTELEALGYRTLVRFGAVLAHN